MPVGMFGVNFARTRYRPKPGGGGRLSVELRETAPLVAGRSIEVTLFDDTGSMAPGESFAAEDDDENATHKARVETYSADEKRWHTNGHGNVVVDSSSAASVSLTFENLEQVVAGTSDAFFLDGSLSLSVSDVRSYSAGSANLPFANAQPEPVTSEPLNLAAPHKAFSGKDVRYADVTYPSEGDMLTIRASDVEAGTTRRLRIAFPSGHLPHGGQSLPLSKADRVQVFYYEGTDELTGTEKRWRAREGTLFVDNASFLGIELQLRNARMLSNSPEAKGRFEWNGPVLAGLVPPPP